MDSKICIHNIVKKSKIHLFHLAPITDLKPFTESNLFSSSYDGSVKLWCVKSGLQIQSFDQPDELDYTKAERLPIMSFAVSNSQLLSANRHGTLHEFDLISANRTSQVQAHTGPIHHVFIDNSGLVYSCGSKDGYIRGFDLRIPLAKGRRILNIKVNEGGISNALYIFDDFIICSGGGLGQLYMINIRKKSKICWNAISSSFEESGHPKNIIYSIYMLNNSIMDRIQILTSWGNGCIRYYHIESNLLILKKEWTELKNAVRSFKELNGVVYGAGDDGILFSLQI